MLSCSAFSRRPSRPPHNHWIARTSREGRVFDQRFLRASTGWSPSRCEVSKRENSMIMEEAGLLPLERWESFYVIVGSSAGALTGLQFVVIALIAEEEASASMLEVRAFGTPTVVHFCAVLFISAVLSAPWHTLAGAGLVL